MLVSNYTFTVYNGKDFFLYNSLSNALLQVDEDTYHRFLSAKQQKGHLDESGFCEDERDVLKRKCFVCENQEDDFLLYRSKIQQLREQRQYMHLTIAPTMNCCFKCYYCFEHQKYNTYINEECLDAIIQYILKQKELEKINLTWFGGEPLMAQPQIKMFHEKLIENKIDISNTNIITTGYHIDKDTLSLFKYIGLSSIQITLDGSKEEHNRIKHFSGCDDVFERIMENISLVLNDAPNIHVSIRVNITRHNMNSFPEIFNFLSLRFQSKNISVTPAIVKNKMVKNENLSSFLSNKEFFQFIMDLYYKYGIVTPFIEYPQNQICECAIRDKMAISFDPEGNAYKCWEKIGDKKYAIGKINKTGILENINIKELNRELYGADPMLDSTCSKCSFLPICNGGCPIERIQKQFENKVINTCTFCKEDFGSYLAANIDQRWKL